MLLGKCSLVRPSKLLFGRVSVLLASVQDNLDQKSTEKFLWPSHYGRCLVFEVTLALFSQSRDRMF